MNNGESSQHTSSQGQEDIARIVKETINVLSGKSASDEHVKRELEEIVHALTESKGRVGGAHGAAARMGMNRIFGGPFLQRGFAIVG